MLSFSTRADRKRRGMGEEETIQWARYTDAAALEG